MKRINTHRKIPINTHSRSHETNFLTWKYMRWRPPQWSSTLLSIHLPLSRSERVKKDIVKFYLCTYRRRRRRLFYPILFIHYLFLSVWFSFVLSLNVDRFKLIQKLQIGREVVIPFCLSNCYDRIESDSGGEHWKLLALSVSIHTHKHTSTH